MKKNMHYPLRSFIGLVAVLLFVNSCSISKETKIEKREIFKSASRYDLGWECGRIKCGSEFSLQEYWGDGTYGSNINMKLEMLKLRDEYVVALYEINNEKCNLVNEVKVNKNADSVGYMSLLSLENNVMQYQGEEMKDKYCFDSPWKTLFWGNEKQCNQMAVFCSEMPLLESIAVEFESETLKALGFGSESSLYKLKISKEIPRNRQY